MAFGREDCQIRIWIQRGVSGIEPVIGRLLASRRVMYAIDGNKMPMYACRKAGKL